MKKNKETDLERNHTFMEKYFERGLWGTRYIVVIAVIFSTISAISLFLIGSYEIVEALLHDNPFTTTGHGHANILSTFI